MGHDDTGGEFVKKHERTLQETGRFSLSGSESSGYNPKVLGLD